MVTNNRPLTTCSSGVVRRRLIRNITAMSLPFLPGNSSNRQLGKERFHKSQHFVTANGIQMLTGSERPGIGGELLPDQKIKPTSSVYPKGQSGDLPSWVVFDHQVLCFEAYFQDAVPEAQNETYRIRKCKIYFFLENDTIQVVEPEYKNSGIPQGTLIHRQRVPLPPPNEDQFYNVYHFNIDHQMVLYSRVFTLTDCDSFTRRFLTKLGVHVNNPATVPEDPYSTLRQQLEENMKPHRPYERRDTLKQFLDQDGKVLRFNCFWDDTENTFGEPRELLLHYFLADDTVEIIEIVSPNSGRVPKFLRRSKLPKHSFEMKQPGQVTDRTVLNVFSLKNQAQRYLLDSLKTGALHDDFYKDCDLTIGGEVNVWGRRVIITDCDGFTKEYYRSKYGIEDFTPVQYKAPPAPKPPRPVPPYNGFGSEEDSLRSCQGLLPKPPRKDFQKFMEKDGFALNFRAKMVTAEPVDADRVFVVSFYLCDDTISVFERPQRNSGILGGRFLERGKVKKPRQELFKSEPSDFFKAQDLYVGATLCLNNVHFQILDADEFTLNYMEQHAEEFPKANVGRILSKLQAMQEEKQSEVRRFVALSDPSNTGFIPYESFRALLTGLGCSLSEHEVLVLGRRFSERERPETDVGLMLAVAQDFLMKKRFEEFSNMANAFAHQDRHKTGRLPVQQIRTICMSFKLPLSENLLAGLLSKFADGEQVDYHAFLAGINWLTQRAPPVTPADILKFDLKARFDTDEPSVKNVHYSSLLKDVLTSHPGSLDPTATST